MLGSNSKTYKDVKISSECKCMGTYKNQYYYDYALSFNFLQNVKPNAYIYYAYIYHDIRHMMYEDIICGINNKKRVKVI